MPGREKLVSLLIYSFITVPERGRLKGAEGGGEGEGSGGGAQGETGATQWTLIRSANFCSVQNMLLAQGFFSGMKS